MKYGRGQHPNSKKNLLKEPPKETRSKGGKQSAINQKKRRELQEVVRNLLDLPMYEGETEELSNIRDAKNKNLTVKESMILAQIRKALLGDVQSFKALVDASGEKPREQYTHDKTLEVESFEETMRRQLAEREEENANV